MHIEIKNQLTSDTAHTLLIPCKKDQPLPSDLVGWLSVAGVSNDQLERDFHGNKKEHFCFYLPIDGATKRICLIGLGKNPGFSSISNSLRSYIHNNCTRLTPQVGLYLTHWQGEEPWLHQMEAALNGMLLGRYHLGKLKSKNKKPSPFQSESAQIQVFLDEKKAGQAESIIARTQQIASTQMEIFDLVNQPSNHVTPQKLASWAQASGKASGYRVEVFDKPKLEKEGFHALLAVNRGSADPAVFIKMDYQPREKEPLATVCLVGKGVTFDAGGVSIKPSANMHYMKSDMGGAAAVLGAIDLAAKLQLPLRVIGLIPSTDNSVDAHALQPSEVISSYSGKTIEIIDTDAEGRLILADGLSYAVRNYKPDVLVDLATLTGSTIRTLGYVAAGLFSNNDQLAQDLMDAGETSGERLWRLPIWDDFKDGIRSDIADVKNLSGKPTAGAIYAAKFLEVFTNGHPAWAHLDIAGVAMKDTEFSTQKTATAYGVRLLLEYFEKLCAKSR